MKKGIKLYWFLFAIGAVLLSALGLFEQNQITDTEAQLQHGYEKVQRVIRSKELGFVDFIQSDLLTDTNNLQRNWNSIYKQLRAENSQLFITKNDTLIFWSTTALSTQQFKYKDNSNHAVIKGANGWYLLYKQQRGSYTYQFAYLIKQQFAYRNQYLQNLFSEELNFLDEAIIVNTKINDKYTDIYSVSGQYLFSIQIFSLHKTTGTWLLAIMLALLAYCILIAHVLIRYYIRIYPTVTTLVFFTVMIWVRATNTLYSVPHFIYSLKLFNPGIYASSIWFPSLGDLLIDSGIVFWYFILLENRKNHVRSTSRSTTLYDILFNAVICLFASNVVFTSIRSLTIDSQISFDITKIYNINAFTYYAIAACIIQLLTVYFISRNLTRALRKYKGNKQQLALAGISLIVAFLLSLWAFNSLNLIHLLGVLGLATTFVTFKWLTPRLNRFQQYFFVIVIIASYTSVSIWHWYNIREQDNRKLFAVKQISQNDITNDYFLRSIARKIKNDGFVKTYFQSPFINKNQFEKRVRQLYFTGYLGKFDVQLLDYDSAGSHFKERNELSFNQANKLYEEQAEESFAEAFRYMQNSGDIKGYIGKFVIKENRNRIGYLFISLRPKLIQNENRFDEILMEGTSSSRQKVSEYSYAVYKDKKLVYQSGDYAYSIINTWGESLNEFKLFDENNYSHLLYTNGQPLTVVVSKPENNISQVIGLFSFIFTCCTVVLIMVLLLFILLNSQLLKRTVITNNSITGWIRNSLLKLMMMDQHQIILIRTRIQTSIVFIVFTTLVFSSYFTIKFTVDKYNLRQTDRLMKKLRNIVINVENERISSLDDQITQGETEAFINQIADFYDTDIILYNPKGEVKASSISKLYDEHIVGTTMHPLAYFHLNQLRESQYSQNEKIGTLIFQAAYAPIFNSRSEVMGYLQLPYFSKQVDLLNEISSVIIGFINLYVLLFIIIVVIAYWVSRNISYPLTLIQQRLSNTSLGASNEPIVWQRDDEIGELVKQYNSMILQLDESARKLAETERQGAWREIARQIAHEIKNPLTPMKLSIQHLQRAYANQDENIGEKIKRTSNLLIAQIDILSELANEFSSFAKMPAPSYENINVHLTLSQLVDLYSQGNEHHITLHCPTHLYLSFDTGYFNRAISNLIKNALQAMPDGEIGEVQVEAIESGNDIKIFVKDNASGMTEEQASKIFVPYFSTKVSGMGLGLPIVKNMIESGGGSITFTTKLGVGTEFCITLPKQQQV